MSVKEVNARLDRLLKPLGFERRRMTWNRHTNSIVEVLDVQMIPVTGLFTVNLGVLDPEVESTLWGKTPSFAQPFECTVRARIGELIGRPRWFDIWWEGSDQGAAEDVAGKIAEYALPFFERMHRREAMVEWLAGAYVARKCPGMPESIYLAILKHFLSETEVACAMLAEFQEKGIWEDRAAEVAARLGCA